MYAPNAMLFLRFVLWNNTSRIAYLENMTAWDMTQELCSHFSIRDCEGYRSFNVICTFFHAGYSYFLISYSSKTFGSGTVKKRELNF